MSHTTNSRTISRKRRRSGVTLVESVVAISIFALFITAACQLVVVTKQTGDRARMRFAAVNIAKNRLERIMAFEFEQVDQFEMSNIRVSESGASSSRGDFRVSTTVSDAGNGLKFVTVHVDILNKHTRKFDGESQELSSFVADFKTLRTL